MAASTIMVQSVDANNDPIEGANGPVFLTDIDAVAQIIATSLKLLLGEWWEDTTLGLPLFQKMIGASGSQAAQNTSQIAIQNVILGCPFVSTIQSFTFTSNPATRAQGFTCDVLTAFGALTVTTNPGDSAAVVTS